MINEFAPCASVHRGLPGRVCGNSATRRARACVVEYRHAHGALDRVPALAAELIRLNVGVLFVGGTVSATAGHARRPGRCPSCSPPPATRCGSGLVASLARPGGNATGLSLLSPELSGKQLELLKAAGAPPSTRVAILYNRNNPAAGRVTGRDARRGPFPGGGDPGLRGAAAKGPRRSVLGAHRIADRRRPRAPGPDLRQRASADRDAGRSEPLAGHVRAARVRGGRRPRGVRAELRRQLPAGRGLRGSDPQGRQHPPISPSSSRRSSSSSSTARRHGCSGLAIPQALRLQADQVIE